MQDTLPSALSVLWKGGLTLIIVVKISQWPVITAVIGSKIKELYMFQVREDEPKYAFLQDKDSQHRNRYGKPIELVPEGLHRSVV